MGKKKKEKAIKISVTLHHHPVHNTNDLGDFRIDQINFNMYWETVVTDIQLTVK